MALAESNPKKKDAQGLILVAKGEGGLGGGGGTHTREGALTRRVGLREQITPNQPTGSYLLSTKSSQQEQK